MGNLTKNFDRAEFACPCCGFDNIDIALVSKLQIIRDHLKRPIIITSGRRCAKKNKEVGGKPKSAHLMGYAVDIAVPDNRYRDKILELSYFAGFNRRGIGKDFIHLDIGDYRDLTTYPAGVCFIYD